MTWISWALAAGLLFCITWASYLHRTIELLSKRLNILTSIVVSGLTPQQLLAMQQFDIQVVEREPKQS